MLILSVNIARRHEYKRVAFKTVISLRYLDRGMLIRSSSHIRNLWSIADIWSMEVWLHSITSEWFNYGFSDSSANLRHVNWQGTVIRKPTHLIYANTGRNYDIYFFVVCKLLCLLHNLPTFLNVHGCTNCTFLDIIITYELETLWFRH